MNKKWLLLLLIISLSNLGLYSQENRKMVSTGIDMLMATEFKALKGKKVGLITNPTGVNAYLVPTIDILHRAEGVELIALFGPEHGVRGDHSAGEKVYSRNDPQTGIPVYSLYGKSRKPNKQMLKGIDVLIYDIQDIGCRSYTYISTMGLAMEAAAENDITFMVLDRPNPLGGNKIEGSLAREEWFSLVGAYPIPYVYGLTCGELAIMINEEGWLKDGKKCRLEVVEMYNWERDMTFSETDLHWVPSSPHIPDAEKAPYYVATGILGELGVFNIGVGYTLPFELIANEFINPELMLDALNYYYKDKVLFRAITYKPYYGKQQGKVMRGVQIYIIEPQKTDLMSIQFKFLEVFHRLYPNVDIPTLCEDRHNMFDKVNGGPAIRETFFERYKYQDIEEILTKDVQAFRELSTQYYLYP
jgi:uncharacterized protein YbbC (DUF1343 family)